MKGTWAVERSELLNTFRNISILTEIPLLRILTLMRSPLRLDTGAVPGLRHEIYVCRGTVDEVHCLLRSTPVEDDLVELWNNRHVLTDSVS